MKGHNRGKERKRLGSANYQILIPYFVQIINIICVCLLYLLILNISVSIPFEFFLEYELDRNDGWMDHDDNDYYVDCDDEDRRVAAGKGSLPRKTT